MNLSTNKYQNSLLILSIFCMGYVASLFLTYSYIVMPGLSIIDDRSFVSAFQGLESRFAFEPSGYSNLPAMIAFPGSLILTLLAAIFAKNKSIRVLVISAWVLFVAGLVSTFLVNLPSNEFIYTAGNPDNINVTKVRQEFNEIAWTNWNHFRAITTTIGVILLFKAYQINQKHT